jgi:hypothetical protein
MLLFCVVLEWSEVEWSGMLERPLFHLSRIVIEKWRKCHPLNYEVNPRLFITIRWECYPMYHEINLGFSLTNRWQCYPFYYEVNRRLFLTSRWECYPLHWEVNPWLLITSRWQCHPLHLWDNPVLQLLSREKHCPSPSLSSASELELITTAPLIMFTQDL